MDRPALGQRWQFKRMSALRRRGLQPLAGAVSCAGTRVHEEREAEEVCELGGLPDAVGATEVEAVVDGAVDGLGVIAPTEQAREGRV